LDVQTLVLFWLLGWKDAAIAQNGARTMQVGTWDTAAISEIGSIAAPETDPG